MVNLLKNILLIIINIFRTDKVVTDMSIREFENAFKSNFSDYVEHLVIAWYLRNAKTEGLSPQSLPEHMIWMIGDFAQNILVIKRHETAEEYFKRPEIALHGIISGFVSSSDKKQHKMSNVTSSDFR